MLNIKIIVIIFKKVIEKIKKYDIINLENRWIYEKENICIYVFNVISDRN